ncbi:polyphosphate polymerase domain-containing protein [bacterium]|nr:polyphosphate polymerase domain-containing protein [bacterium]
MAKAVDNYRYERKFFISDITRHDVESIVKLHPAMFSAIFHQRFVNSIYFDAIDFRNYFDNVNGSSHRVKIRIRWYGELFGHINKPVLELKIKNESLNRKQAYPLHPFDFNNGFAAEEILDIINKSDVPEIIKINSLKPMLLTHYRRKYFRSADGNYRITIDTDLVFYHIYFQKNLFINKLTDDINVILELKYNKNADNNANYITNFFPFRLSKSSKYVTGIDKLYIC